MGYFGMVCTVGLDTIDLQRKKYNIHNGPSLLYCIYSFKEHSIGLKMIKSSCMVWNSLI